MPRKYTKRTPIPSPDAPTAPTADAPNPKGIKRQRRVQLNSFVDSSAFDLVQHPKKRAYLVAFSRLGNQMRASEAAGVDRVTVNRWMHDKTDAEYQKGLALAHELCGERLEAEAERRAVEGFDKPVYQGGRLVGYERTYSDTLLIFLMKGLMPHKYRDRIDISGQVAVPLFILPPGTHVDVGSLEPPDTSLPSPPPMAPAMARKLLAVVEASTVNAENTEKDKP